MRGRHRAKGGGFSVWIVAAVVVFVLIVLAANVI